MTLNDNYILWIMGPTSSGKTTIAESFLYQLRTNNVPVIHFDGDEVRDFFGDDHGFSSTDRLKVVKTLVHLANKSIEAGMNVIVSALTANEDAREYVEKNVINLIKVYIQCEIEVCIARDPKGLYKAAREGGIKTLAGYNSEYLPPKNPHIIINTGSNSVEESVSQLITSLSTFGYRQR